MKSKSLLFSTSSYLTKHAQVFKPLAPARFVHTGLTPEKSVETQSFSSKVSGTDLPEVSLFKAIPVKSSENFIFWHKKFEDKTNIFTLTPLCKVSASLAYGSLIGSLINTLENSSYLPIIAGINLSLLTYILYFYDSASPTIFTDKVTVNEFSQSSFDKTIRAIYPEIKFGTGGNCFGHTYMWYIFLKQEKAYISELQKIEASITSQTPLTKEQNRLLSSIAALQDSQHELRYHQSVTNGYARVLIRSDRQNLVQCLLGEVEKNPGELYNIINYNKFAYKIYAAHIIGITQNSHGNIILFDANKGEVVCKNIEEAKKNVSKLLCTTYSGRSEISHNLLLWKKPTLEHTLPANEPSIRPRP